MTKFTYTLQDDNITIEELLRDRLDIGKKRMHELRMAKAILNEQGEPLVWQHHYPAGTKLVFQLPFESSEYVPSEKYHLDVRYEDDHLLIVNKPAGMLTHPNEDGQTGTLMNDVTAYMVEKGATYAEHIHRLDQGTSGLIVIAKHSMMKSLLDRMLEEKKILRFYEAIVEGVVKENHGSIKTAIGRDRHHPTRQVVSKSGKPAVTHFEVVGKHPNFTKLNVVLETGRTHQIRVHLASIGYPVVGDTMYGAITRSENYQLHAFRILFVHPINGEEIKVEYPMEQAFKK
ncbi:RluA family pseudouridine synthase [Paenisporosarcina cavernae]|uniref:RluA family pseudouridine synthase n=1 Tax=Paenisporosarcina cavernae TaxID=2320858 RepID=UPI00268E2E86